LDGHKGTKNEKVSDKDVGDFQLVLSALDEGRGTVTFVIHASSNVIRMSGMGSGEFLVRLGYKQYRGECPFFDDRCLWLTLAELGRQPFLDEMAVERVHHAFRAHATALPELYNHYNAFRSKISLPGSRELDLFPELREAPVPVIEPTPGALPKWVADLMPPRYGEVMKQIDEFREEHRRLRSMAALLWETGDNLSEAVRDLFDALGYEASLTAKGATYDVTVSMGVDRRLLVEVTGIEGALKKDSKKIGQVLQALQKEAGPQDRVTVALNAHRQKPPQERAGVEIVTKEALSLLTGLEANIVTTSTLFEIWKTSLEDTEAAKKRIEELYTLSGGHFE
jgi:hypothetical protein